MPAGRERVSQEPDLVSVVEEDEGFRSIVDVRARQSASQSSSQSPSRSPSPSETVDRTRTYVSALVGDTSTLLRNTLRDPSPEAERESSPTISYPPCYAEVDPEALEESHANSEHYRRAEGPSTSRSPPQTGRIFSPLDAGAERVSLVSSYRSPVIPPSQPLVELSRGDVSTRQTPPRSALNRVGDVISGFGRFGRRRAPSTPTPPRTWTIDGEAGTAESSSIAGSHVGRRHTRALFTPPRSGASDGEAPTAENSRPNSRGSNAPHPQQSSEKRRPVVLSPPEEPSAPAASSASASHTAPIFDPSPSAFIPPLNMQPPSVNTQPPFVNTQPPFVNSIPNPHFQAPQGMMPMPPLLPQCPQQLQLQLQFMFMQMQMLLHQYMLATMTRNPCDCSICQRQNRPTSK